jgi:hypothetical protein
MLKKITFLLIFLSIISSAWSLAPIWFMPFGFGSMSFRSNAVTSLTRLEEARTLEKGARMFGGSFGVNLSPYAHMGTTYIPGQMSAFQDVYAMYKMRLGTPGRGEFGLQAGIASPGSSFYVMQSIPISLGVSYKKQLGLGQRSGFSIKFDIGNELLAGYMVSTNFIAAMSLIFGTWNPENGFGFNFIPSVAGAIQLGQVQVYSRVLMATVSPQMEWNWRISNKKDTFVSLVGLTAGYNLDITHSAYSTTYTGFVKAGVHVGFNGKTGNYNGRKR